MAQVDNGVGRHGWAVAEFINKRNLLLFEDGDRLVLLPVTGPEWFETRKLGEGAMSVEIQPSAGKVRLFLQRG